jgi:DNA-binding MurR/RpiR family transcriptional regulator
VTNSEVNAVARFAHENYIAEIESAAMRSSFVAPLALMDALIAACASVKQGRVLKLLSEAAEEQLYGYRWYEDSSER